MATVTTTHCDLCHRDVTHRKPYQFNGQLRFTEYKRLHNVPEKEDTFDLCRECVEAMKTTITKMQSRRTASVDDRVEAPRV